MGFWSKIKAAVRVVVCVVIEVLNRVTLGVLDLLLGFFAWPPKRLRLHIFVLWSVPPPVIEGTPVPVLGCSTSVFGDYIIVIVDREGLETDHLTLPHEIGHSCGLCPRHDWTPSNLMNKSSPALRTRNGSKRISYALPTRSILVSSCFAAHPDMPGGCLFELAKSSAFGVIL